MQQNTAQAQAPFLVLIGMAALGLGDNLLLFLIETGSLWQFHLLRGALVVAGFCAIAAAGFGTLRPQRPWAVLARSLVIALALVIYFGCLSIMPIGVVVAGFFTAPLFIVLISVIFQGMRVGKYRWGAVIVGFAGTLLVIQPDPAALDPVMFLPVLGGFFYAVGAVATRAWCTGEDTVALSVGFFAMLTLAGAIGCLLLPASGSGAEGFTTRGWMPLDLASFGWIAAQAVGALIGIFCIFRGYQVGEASYVAVFEYALLVFASFWAYVIWGQTVTPLALVGMLLIAGAGVVIARRSE